MALITSGFPSDGRWPRFLLPRGEAAVRDCRVGFPSSISESARAFSADRLGKVSAVNWGRRRKSRRLLFLFQMNASLRHAGKGTAQAGAADRLHGAQIVFSGNDHGIASAVRTRHGNASEVFPCAR